MAIRLLRFGAPGCGACKAMDRAGTLDAFEAEHKDVRVKRYEFADEPKTQAEKDVEALGDKLDVHSIPTLIFVDEKGEVLARADHALPRAALEKLYQEARAEAGNDTDEEDTDDDDRGTEDED